MQNLSVQDIIKVEGRKGYAVFENDSRNFNLNYVGIRDDDKPGYWNDMFFVFWKYKGLWSKVARVGTTDPGIYYLEHPLNAKGTAILPEGQYRGALKLGVHRGRYEAMVQAKQIGVFRDNNLDGKLDMDGPIDIGWHGINHHRALTDHEVKTIGRFSAGCQVTLNPDDYSLFMALCNQSEKEYSQGITYTLMNINDF